MNKKSFLILAVLLVMCLSTVYAGNESRIGTAGAQELLFPTSARGAALGGSVVANTFGVDAMYWNPAGLAYLEGSEAMFTHIPWLAGINVEYAAFATTIEDLGTIGFSAKIVSIGDIEETTESYPDGTGRVFSPSMAVIGLTFAKPLTTNINFGFTAHAIREDIFEVSASGFAFDFGFTYEPRWQGFRIGIAMKNFGPDMTFRGQGFERDNGDRPVASKGASFELPTALNVGLSYDVYTQDMHSLTAMGNFQANNHGADVWQSGAEYGYDDWLFVRGGYKFSDLGSEEDDPLGESSSDQYIYGVSLGGGITRTLGSLNVTIEYTWWQTDVFDANQFFTMKLGF